MSVIARAEQVREERLACNEAVHRAFNESLEAFQTKLAGTQTLAGFVCECGDSDCVDIVKMGIARYEKIRHDPCLFLVRPGHEIPDIEDVVKREDGFAIVRKHDNLADLARETDPRR